MNYHFNQEPQNTPPEGDPAYYGYTAPLVSEKTPVSQGFGVAALICGIISLLCCCCYGFSLLLGIVAIVTACLDRARAGSFRGLAITGLILGILGTILGVVMLVDLVAVLGDPLFSEIMNAYYEGVESGDLTKFYELLEQYGVQAA